MGVKENGEIVYTPTPKVSFQETGFVHILENDFTGEDVKDEAAHLINKFSFDQNPTEFQFKQKNVQFILQESSKGRGSYNVGENHLVWTDGEPVDPFHIGVVQKDEKGEYQTLLGRSVLGSSTFTDFSPQQRAVAGRGPIFKSIIKSGNFVPEWATNDLEYWHTMRVETPWKNRLPFLRGLVKEQAIKLGEEGETDGHPFEIPSLAERSRIIVNRGFPKDTAFPDRGGNSLFRWRNGYCLYSHFVSAEDIMGSLDFVDPELKIDKDKKWIVRYALGSCDADAGALIHTYGELYIPIN